MDGGKTISSMITTYFLYIENSLGVNLVEAYSSCNEKQKSMLFYRDAPLFLFLLETAESIAFGAISARNCLAKS